MKQLGGMTPPKEHFNSPTIDPELQGLYKMPEIEFKIMILRKCNMMQEDTDGQLKEMRKMIGE